ncbi:predicted protein [Coccidioides posadasii str. Silveira]|uniref:Predicted protein n=1 Tax=Coccidioides posadasii (strain RMSCC 757 / Silveira) TaxID=443226 RepID=E9CR34_COCPS|nr:predicted protein [Coccidioides posadasii str. Silveira]
MPGMEPALLLRHAPYNAIDLWLLFASLAVSILLVTRIRQGLSLAYDIGDSQEGLFSTPLLQQHGQQSHHGDQHARKEGSHASGNGVLQLDRSYKRRVLIYRLAFVEYGSADHLALRRVDTSLGQQWRCFSSIAEDDYSIRSTE